MTERAEKVGEVGGGERQWRCEGGWVRKPGSLAASRRECELRKVNGVRQAQIPDAALVKQGWQAADADF